MSTIEALNSTSEPETQLPAQKVVSLRTDETIALEPTEYIKNTNGHGFESKLYPYGRLTTVINAGSKLFGLFDIRRDSAKLHLPDTDFLLVDSNFDLRMLLSGKHNSIGYKEIQEGQEPVQIGRNHLTDRFTYPSTTSRDHFEVYFSEGKIKIHNLKPGNHTIIYAEEPPPAKYSPEEDLLILNERTVKANERIEKKAAYGKPSAEAPYGTFMNHPVIGRNSESVQNGVYLGGGNREAIVVDNNSEILKNAYSDLKEYLNIARPDSTPEYLRAINVFVQSIMIYDGPKVDRITSKFGEDKLLGLSEFVTQKAGICRHQALLACYFMERLVKDEFSKGEIHIQRNTIPEYGGTHAWAVFTDPEGHEFVIDPAQNFVGTKKEARQQPGKWNYYTPVV